MRPYYLDGDLTGRGPVLLAERLASIGPVIPVNSTARLSKGGRCGFCAVFKDRREACTPADAGYARARSSRDCPTAGGRRSLKTQQHAGVVADLPRSHSK
jgi:hypothetical protein